MISWAVTNPYLGLNPDSIASLKHKQAQEEEQTSTCLWLMRLHRYSHLLAQFDFVGQGSDSVGHTRQHDHVAKRGKLADPTMYPEHSIHSFKSWTFVNDKLSSMLAFRPLSVLGQSVG